MRPLFLPDGEPPPAGALAVDCARCDCAALYSHWPGHPAPPAIIADTSTAILLRASLDAERWLDPYQVCCNDHVDVDGLLACCLACRPELSLRHGPLLVGAAAFGDFDSWPGPEAAALALTLHQRIAAEQAAGNGWQQRCYELVVDGIEDLIDQSRESDPERDSQIEHILRLRHGFMDKPHNHPLTITAQAGWSTISGQWRLGHRGTGPTTVGQLDDCPPAAIDGFVAEAHCRLVQLAGDEGTAYCFAAPPHSWAHTVRLPQVPWPDCNDAARELNAADSGPGTWLAGESVRQHGFTWLLARIGNDGTLAPSQIPPERIHLILQELFDADGRARPTN